MKIKIIGSGGCVSTPKPCCSCSVCTEAREKGFSYARTGCSLFIEEEKVLIDTPEDINYALNHANIDQVKVISLKAVLEDFKMQGTKYGSARREWD